MSSKFVTITGVTDAVDKPVPIIINTDHVVMVASVEETPTMWAILLHGEKGPVMTTTDPEKWLSSTVIS